MFCTRCKNPLRDCVCDDLEERLAALAEHPNFATDRCRNCKQHRVDCTCETYEPFQ